MLFQIRGPIALRGETANHFRCRQMFKHGAGGVKNPGVGVGYDKYGMVTAGFAMAAQSFGGTLGRGA